MSEATRTSGRAALVVAAISAMVVPSTVAGVMLIVR